MTHLRFDDETLELEDAPDVPTPTLQGEVIDSSGLITPVCCSSIKVDYSKDPAYVFRLVVNPSTSTLAASTSQGVVKLYQVQPGSAGRGQSVTHVGNLEGHQGTITGLEAAPDDPNAVYTCASDGTVRAWDLRTGQQAQSFSAPGQELLCVGVQEHLVASGGQGEVHFWDRRTSTAMAKLEDTHMDDVTQVKFCPNSTRHVISGSLDGLVAVHDTVHPLNHDDAFVAAINVATSVEELGTYGPQHERLWVRTGTETLHLWEWSRTLNENQQGGEGAFAEFHEAREAATHAAQAAGGAAAKAFGEGVEYFAGCHYDQARGQLLVMAGREGDAGFWPVEEFTCPAGSGARVGAALGAPGVLLSGAHTSVVRTFVCDPQEGLCCVTGGEDAQICLWTLDKSLAQSKIAQGSEIVMRAGLGQGAGHGGGQGRHKGGQGGAGPMKGHKVVQEQGRGGGKKGRRKGGDGGHQSKRIAPY